MYDFGLILFDFDRFKMNVIDFDVFFYVMLIDFSLISFGFG